LLLTASIKAPSVYRPVRGLDKKIHAGMTAGLLSIIYTPVLNIPRFPDHLPHFVGTGRARACGVQISAQDKPKNLPWRWRTFCTRGRLRAGAFGIRAALVFHAGRAWWRPLSIPVGATLARDVHAKARRPWRNA
jgi:hypothetical protein